MEGEATALAAVQVLSVTRVSNCIGQVHLRVTVQVGNRWVALIKLYIF